ncbi:hypothetical protein FGADI_5740 [Fusarium gaditjirri]|uniref:NACHT domain-containing protein n=1 Tax=Fusarium gaditjirri TaxID=282569 RepID=A0A8H4WX91_9HYPO|nr:hypothetical protein FGADI_5740 [Fusarium gaditjirri]
MSNYIDRIYGPKDIHATSVMPGGIASNLQKHLPEAVQKDMKEDPSTINFMKSPEQGAATTVLAAVGKEWEGKGGKYLEDCRPSIPQPLIPGVKGYRDYIYVSEKENRTWKLTLETLGPPETPWRMKIMKKRTLKRQDYRVGWICALPIELAAAQEILDEEHDYFYDRHESANTLDSLYTLGRVGDHNVVLAGLPAGQLGTNSAAATAIQMQKDFPSIQFGLMVGIGGGVPSNGTDIRLGDVVVSQPHETHGGVIQYDLGKTRPGKFERTGFLNSPPMPLLEAVAQLQARQLRSQDIFSKHISSFRHLPYFSRDYAGPDRLYQASYCHVGGSDCSKCSTKHLINRPIRRGREITVHQGTIASGNQVMRDGVERDRLSLDLGGVLCFEMEAAGLMNRFSCLVIRGICDYADSHKNKRWQPYAAMTAAAYAKALLSVVPSTEPTPMLGDFIASRGNNQAEEILNLNCQKLIESLEYPEMYRRQIVIKRPWIGTGEWLFRTREYQAWLKGTHRFLWIKGKAGAGKSVLMKRTLQELQMRSDSGVPAVAFFFFDGSGTGLEKSSTGLLRAILYQLFTQNRNLVEEFMTASDGRFVKGRNLDWELRELMEVFEMSSQLQSWRPTILLLDGLDEGSTEEVRTLVSFFKQHIFTEDPRAMSKLRICLSSRHYPTITMDDCLELFVESHNNTDIETFTHQKLSISPKSPNNDKMVQSILERADGVFLWVDLVTSSILEADDSGETLQGKLAMLHATPRELDGLYSQVFLKLTSNERLDTFRMLSWVLMATRRLTPVELCFAMQFEPSQPLVTFDSWKQSSRFIADGGQQEKFIQIFIAEGDNIVPSYGNAETVCTSVPIELPSMDPISSNLL